MSINDTGRRSACLILVVLLCTGVPAVQANGGGMTSAPGMMGRAEERAPDNATHEEMEELMEKWMAAPSARLKRNGSSR